MPHRRGRGCTAEQQHKRGAELRSCVKCLPGDALGAEVRVVAKPDRRHPLAPSTFCKVAATC